MSTRSNPFEELEQLFERMNRQFGEPADVWGSDGPLRRWASGEESPPIDLVDRDDEFVATVDLPGFEHDDISIRVTDRTLHVAAEHEEIVDEDEGRLLRHERRHDSTRRSIRLPEEVDKGGVKARMEHGVLTVVLPKTETENARTIEIEAE